MREDELTEQRFERASEVISAVSNGKRIGLVKTLLRGECIVGDLALVVGLSQSATSQHLRILKLTGILLQRKDAQIRFCRINPNMVSILERLIRVGEQGGSSVDQKMARRRP
jgi:DNA-binding transcriptional ArsR family regulator